MRFIRKLFGFEDPDYGTRGTESLTPMSQDQSPAASQDQPSSASQDQPLSKTTLTVGDLHDLHYRQFSDENLRAIDATLVGERFGELEWMVEDEQGRHRSPELSAILQNVLWHTVNGFKVNARQLRPGSIVVVGHVTVSAERSLNTLVMWSCDPDGDRERIERARKRLVFLLEGLPRTPDVNVFAATTNRSEVPSRSDVATRDAGPAEQVRGQVSGTAIILFADIADSTALTERLGDAAFRDKAGGLDAALRRAILSNGGQVIDGKLLGDGVLATFGAASGAIACAAAMHEAGSAMGLLLHLGIHAGDVIREANNVYGGSVNIAARVASEAAAGETLVSATVRDLARTSAGVSFEDRGRTRTEGRRRAGAGVRGNLARTMRITVQEAHE